MEHPLQQGFIKEPINFRKVVFSGTPCSYHRNHHYHHYDQIHYHIITSLSFHCYHPHLLPEPAFGQVELCRAPDGNTALVPHCVLVESLNKKISGDWFLIGFSLHMLLAETY